jgi:hypothetical protein
MDLREHPIVGHDVPISDLRDFSSAYRSRRGRAYRWRRVET